MKFMKRRSTLIIAISLVLIATLLTSCKGEDKNNGKLKVVTTIFPVYDWTEQIVGEKDKDVDVSMLLSNGTDLHSYQPTAKDIKKIANCDVFIYVGGESDEWVEDVLEEAKNKKIKAINLMDVLGDAVKEEEVKEGMTEGHEDEDEDHDEDEKEYDEHIWLSLKNAKLCSQAIEEALSEVDPSNADTYKANLNNYEEKLDALDSEYQEATANGKQKTLIFGDRFPFRYMVNDYGLDYFAAFVGCSSETEASFKTIKFLSEKADQLGIKHIITIEKSDKKIAETIIKNTSAKNQDILTLDSMQSTTGDDVKSGTSYIEIMKKNLDVLKKAMN